MCLSLCFAKLHIPKAINVNKTLQPKQYHMTCKNMCGSQVLRHDATIFWRSQRRDAAVCACERPLRWCQTNLPVAPSPDKICSFWQNAWFAELRFFFFQNWPPRPSPHSCTTKIISRYTSSRMKIFLGLQLHRRELLAEPSHSLCVGTTCCSLLLLRSGSWVRQLRQHHWWHPCCLNVKNMLFEWKRPINTPWRFVSWPTWK